MRRQDERRQSTDVRGGHGGAAEVLIGIRIFWGPQRAPDRVAGGCYIYPGAIVGDRQPVVIIGCGAYGDDVGIVGWIGENFGKKAVGYSEPMSSLAR